MATIVVAGALANRRGNGGGAWVRLNWVLGLRRLGHAVHLVEQIGAAACTDAAGRPAGLAGSANRAFFRAVADGVGLSGAATLVYEGGEQTDGLGMRELADLAGGADLLVNLGGHLSVPALFGRFRRKAYVDLDPGFTQFWHAAGNAGARLAGHDAFFTVGANVGRPGCPIPTGGVDWRPVRPPVVLDEWPVTPAPADGRFTTVASWRGAFGPVEFGGQTYGVKAHEFRRFVGLPGVTGLPFEVALDIHPGDAKDRDALRASGWRVVDPAAAAGDPHAFRRYVRGSAAEFSPAQGVYVGTTSGWFSDRTACYLASGRPALVQDTGGAGGLPAGDGLLTFRTPEEAAAGAARIARDPAAHARAARDLAEGYLDSDRVLGEFLDRAGV